jgi:hypothetical protein
MSKVIRLDSIRKGRQDELVEDDKCADIWPIQQLSHGSSRDWLQGAICGSELESLARSIWMHYPNLQLASERLAAFITPRWPSSTGGSLLSKAVETAVLKVQESVSGGDTFKGRQVGLYLHGLASCVTDVARIAVYGVDDEGETVMWEYFSEPLKDWAEKRGIHQLQAYLADPNTPQGELLGLRTILIGRIAGNHIDAGNLEMYAARG